MLHNLAVLLAATQHTAVLQLYAGMRWRACYELQMNAVKCAAATSLQAAARKQGAEGKLQLHWRVAAACTLQTAARNAHVCRDYLTRQGARRYLADPENAFCWLVKRMCCGARYQQLCEREWKQRIIIGSPLVKATFLNSNSIAVNDWKSLSNQYKHLDFHAPLPSDHPLYCQQQLQQIQLVLQEQERVQELLVVAQDNLEYEVGSLKTLNQKIQGVEKEEEEEEEEEGKREEQGEEEECASESDEEFNLQIQDLSEKISRIKTDSRSGGAIFACICTYIYVHIHIHTHMHTFFSYCMYV